MKNRILWCLLLVCMVLAWLLDGEVLLLYLAGIGAAAMVLGILCDPGEKAVQAEISLPSTVSAGGELSFSVRLVNQGYRPVFGRELTMTVENLLTGETMKENFGYSLGIRGRRSLSYTLQEKHCGRVRVRIGDQAEAAIVLPEVFPVSFGEEREYSYDCESDEYSVYRPGTDPSETFGIREYEPGDSLKSIHWKLTEKLGETMVRQAGYPVSNSLALFVDTGYREGQDPSPEVMDGLMRAAVSVGQELAEEGIACRLVLPSSREPRIFTVENEDDFASVLPVLMSCRRHSHPLGLPERYLEDRGELPFSRILWFTVAPDGDLDEWSDLTRLTVLCCTNDRQGMEEEAVFFRPEEAEEVLHYLEL